MKEVKIGMGRRGARFMQEGREWILPGLLYANDLEDLRAMVGRFVEVCRLRVLKGKRKVMVMNGKKGLECQVHLDGVRLNFRACIQIQFKFG